MNKDYHCFRIYSDLETYFIIGTVWGKKSVCPPSAALAEKIFPFVFKRTNFFCQESEFILKETENIFKEETKKKR